jgi:hypothetical protein
VPSTPSPENGNKFGFRNVVFFSVLQNTRRWTQSKNPVIQSVIHHCQNPLESTVSAITFRSIDHNPLNCVFSCYFIYRRPAVFFSNVMDHLNSEIEASLAHSHQIGLILCRTSRLICGHRVGNKAEYFRSFTRWHKEHHSIVEVQIQNMRTFNTISPLDKFGRVLLESQMANLDKFHYIKI